MADIDNRDRLRNFSPEEKLQTLRSEMLFPIETIRGLAHVLKDRLEKDALLAKDDLIPVFEAIARNADALKKLLDSLTL